MQIVQKRHLFFILLFLGVGNNVQATFRRGISAATQRRSFSNVIHPSVRAQQLKFTIPQIKELFNRIPQNEQSQKITAPGYSVSVPLGLVATDALLKLDQMDPENLMIVLDGFESKMYEYRDNPQQFLIWVQTKLTWWNALPDEEQARLKAAFSERETAAETIAEPTTFTSERLTSSSSWSKRWGLGGGRPLGTNMATSSLRMPTGVVPQRSEFVPQLESRVADIRKKALERASVGSEETPEVVLEKKEKVAEKEGSLVEPIPLWISVRIDDPTLKKRVSQVARRMTQNLTDFMVGKQTGKMEKSDIDAFKRMLNSVENQGYHLVLADASIMPLSMPKTESVKVWNLTDPIVLMGVRKSSAEKLEYTKPGSLAFMEPSGTLVPGKSIPTVVTVLVGSQFPLTSGMYALQGLPGISFSVRRTDADTLTRFSTALAAIVEPAKIEPKKLPLEAPLQTPTIPQKPVEEAIKEVARPSAVVQPAPPLLLPNSQERLQQKEAVPKLPAPPKRPGVIGPEKLPKLPAPPKRDQIGAPEKVPVLPPQQIPVLSVAPVIPVLEEATVLVPKQEMADLIAVSETLLSPGVDLSGVTKDLVTSAVSGKQLSKEVTDRFLKMLELFNSNGFLVVVFDHSLLETISKEKPFVVYQDAHAGILALPQQTDVNSSFKLDFPQAGAVVATRIPVVRQAVIPVLVGAQSGIKAGEYELITFDGRSIKFVVQQTTPQVVENFFDSLRSLERIEVQEPELIEGVTEAPVVQPAQPLLLPAPQEPVGPQTKTVPKLPAPPKRPAIVGPEKLPKLPAPQPERLRANEIEQRLMLTEAQLTQLQTQLDAAKELVTETDAKNVSLQEKIIQLTAERDELQRKGEEIVTEQREQSKTERSRAEEQIAVEKQKAQQAINQLRVETEDQIRRMQAEVDRAKGEQNIAQERASLADIKASELQRKLSEAEIQLQERSAELSQQIEKLRADLKTAQDDAMQARAEVDAVKMEYSRQLQALESQLEAIKGRIEEEGETLSARDAAYEAQLEVQRNLVQDFAAEAEKNLAEAERLKKMHQAKLEEVERRLAQESERANQVEEHNKGAQAQLQNERQRFDQELRKAEQEQAFEREAVKKGADAQAAQIAAQANQITELTQQLADLQARDARNRSERDAEKQAQESQLQELRDQQLRDLAVLNQQQEEASRKMADKHKADLKQAVETARARQKEQDQIEAEKQQERVIKAARLAEIQEARELEALKVANQELQNRIEGGEQELQRLRADLATSLIKPATESKEVQVAAETREVAAQVAPISSEVGTETIPEAKATEVPKVGVEAGVQTTALVVVPEQPQITYSRWQQFTNWFREKFISPPKKESKEPKSEKKK